MWGEVVVRQRELHSLHLAAICRLSQLLEQIMREDDNKVCTCVCTYVCLSPNDTVMCYFSLFDECTYMYVCIRMCVHTDGRKKDENGTMVGANMYVRTYWCTYVWEFIHAIVCMSCLFDSICHMLAIISGCRL